jgi:hypothetical protein
MRGQREGWGGGIDMNYGGKLKRLLGLSKKRKGSKKKKAKRRMPPRKKNGEFRKRG